MAKLLVGLVQGGERRAGKLQLSARLEADDSALGTSGALQRDDVAALNDAVPAESALHAFEQSADAAIAVVRNRRVTQPVEAELLVLGADAPICHRL